jgi:8-oxo-dGTP pyrophosphatase MutT (NUDIX family)
VIQAGGGLVSNEKGEMLFIYRRGHWDLPKGKLDPGETLESCALREVREETGLTQVELGKHICDTFHTYDQFGKHILKESSWYWMRSEGDEEPIPQTEEDITAIEWLDPEKVRQILPLSYPSIREVAKKAGLI